MADYFSKDHEVRSAPAPPVCRAKALGQARRSPPARAMADYLFKDHKPSAMRGEACLRATRTPTVTLLTIGCRLSAIDYRLSAIDYRLSAIGYRPSAIDYEKPSTMQDKARLHGRERTMYSKTINSALECAFQRYRLNCSSIGRNLYFL